MNRLLFVRSSLAIGIVWSTLSAAAVVGQTLLDPYYPRPNVSAPVPMQPIVAYRKYLAQGLSPRVAAQRSGAYVVGNITLSARLYLMYLGSEGDGSNGGQCAFID